MSTEIKIWPTGRDEFHLPLPNFTDIDRGSMDDRKIAVIIVGSLHRLKNRKWVLGATIIIPPSRVNNGMPAICQCLYKKLYLSYTGLLLDRQRSRNFVFELDIYLLMLAWLWRIVFLSNPKILHSVIIRIRQLEKMDLEQLKSSHNSETNALN